VGAGTINISGDPGESLYEHGVKTWVGRMPAENVLSTCGIGEPLIPHWGRTNDDYDRIPAIPDSISRFSCGIA
jgi:hypothetical protein